jgi:hypothetical protein
MDSGRTAAFARGSESGIAETRISGHVLYFCHPELALLFTTSPLQRLEGHEGLALRLDILFCYQLVHTRGLFVPIESGLLWNPIAPQSQQHQRQRCLGIPVERGDRLATI